MTLRKLTQWSVIGLVCAVILYDIAVMLRGGVDTTVSRITLAWAKANPIIPFCVGVVCGHLFWAQNPEKK